MAFELPELGFSFDALEPHIDAKTMEIHHGKHHAGYVAKLNAAVEGTDLGDLEICQVMGKISELPADKQTAVRNNGGGHFNHSLFWKILAPGGANAPTGDLAAAIDSDLGGLDGFKKQFSAAAATRFGSGWAWLCICKEGKLCVCSTPNQDNPMMTGIVECEGAPILGLDVWEHAYYLNYQNRRPDYISAFFNVINWDAVSAYLEKVKEHA